ncbi:unnamed protein product, partial [Ranitomeya imitator]
MELKELNAKLRLKKTPGVPVIDNNMDISSSSSVTPAVSVSASASTSQASLCSSQGVSQATSEASVEQFVPELAIPQGLLEPNAVSSQESLDLSICSTGSMGSLGSLVEQLDNVETVCLTDVGAMFTTSLLDNQPVSRPIKGFAVVEGKHRVTKRGPALSNPMFTLVTGIVGRWRAVCVTALQRPNSDAAAIDIVVGIAAASLSVTVRSRAKIEKIRASLFNSSDLIGLSSLDGEDELMEMSTEEILTVSTVNQSLFDTQGIPGLGDYFSDKSLK